VVGDGDNRGLGRERRADTIISTKSASTSPVGFTAISFIIFLMAASFSTRREASAPTPGVAQMSGSAIGSSWADARKAVPTTNRIDNVTAVGLTK
jgi:hypothetical protein